MLEKMLNAIYSKEKVSKEVFAQEEIYVVCKAQKNTWKATVNKKSSSLASTPENSNQEKRR